MRLRSKTLAQVNQMGSIGLVWKQVNSTLIWWYFKISRLIMRDIDHRLDKICLLLMKQLLLFKFLLLLPLLYLKIWFLSTVSQATTMPSILATPNSRNSLRLAQPSRSNYRTTLVLRPPKATALKETGWSFNQATLLFRALNLRRSLLSNSSMETTTTTHRMLLQFQRERHLWGRVKRRHLRLHLHQHHKISHRIMSVEGMEDLGKRATERREGIRHSLLKGLQEYPRQ
jgi:hypothetical protein